MHNEFNVEVISEFHKEGNQIKIIKTLVKGPIICKSPSLPHIVSELLMAGYLDHNKVTIDLSLDNPIVFDSNDIPLFVLIPMI